MSSLFHMIKFNSVGQQLFWLRGKCRPTRASGMLVSEPPLPYWMEVASKRFLPELDLEIAYIRIKEQFNDAIDL